jgi:hypothetical protein
LPHGKLGLRIIDNGCRKTQKLARFTQADTLESCPGTNLDTPVVQFVDRITCYRVSNARGHSTGALVLSPHKCTRGLRLEGRRVVLANVRKVNTRKANVTASVRRIVVRKRPMPECCWPGGTPCTPRRPLSFCKPGWKAARLAEIPEFACVIPILSTERTYP